MITWKTLRSSWKNKRTKQRHTRTAAYQSVASLAGRLSVCPPNDMTMAYWLMKSEPDVFSIDDLRRKQVAGWDGVRNYQARNNMRAMRQGDLAFFYHSSTKPPAIVGVMEIVREAYPDPTADEKGWDQVDVRYKKTFQQPLTLDAIKAIPALKHMVLLRNSRLSVQPVTAGEWATLQSVLTD